MNQQPPDLPSETPGDNTGWAQPAGSQGPPGAFVDRQPVPSNPAMPPGAGAPVQPGPPMSVEAPVRDTTFNLMALAMMVGVAIVVLLLLVIAFVVIGAIGHTAR